MSDGCGLIVIVIGAGAGAVAVTVAGIVIEFDAHIVATQSTNYTALLLLKHRQPPPHSPLSLTPSPERLQARLLLQGPQRSHLHTRLLRRRRAAAVLRRAPRDTLLGGVHRQAHGRCGQSTSESVGHVDEPAGTVDARRV